MHSIGSMAPSRSRNRPNRRRSGQTSFFSVLYRRPMSTRRIALSLYACLGLALGVGCSSTADHGILGEEHGNARVAREAAIDFGLLADPELDLYMNEIGQRLVFSLPRPSFAYSFRVVNEVQPKAWVRPGGFGYLSRGLLSLANNEDEVACVLGHEIIHAEQRHVAPRQASNEDANPVLRSWYRAARRGAYSREMERVADEGGQHLCAAAGYDPIAMATLLASLRRAERSRFGFSLQPGFLAIHPGLQERMAINSARAGKIAWKRDPRIGDPRQALLDRIEGIDIGQRPQSGLFVEHRFLDPTRDFQIAFPAAWQRSASHRVVGAQSPDTGAIVFLKSDQQAGDPQTLAEEWLEAHDDDDLRVESSRKVLPDTIRAAARRM